MTVDKKTPASVDGVQSLLREQGYFADRSLATAIYLALTLKRPLLLEGVTGVGKSQVAASLAAGLQTELIRLQCYAGLNIDQAVYEWNYSRQLLEIRLVEAGGGTHADEVSKGLFREEFLIKRPLLQAIDASRRQAPVLLIDDLDQVDEAFEGFLLEFLADYRVTIPEFGSVQASVQPIVFITSNRTRDIHDAIRRRCVYHWMDYPKPSEEIEIVTARFPNASRRLVEQITGLVQELRQSDLSKVPGVINTIDWAATLTALDQTEIDAQAVEEIVGLLQRRFPTG